MAKLDVANEIQHQIDDQIRMREGAMKLMSACSTLNQALETSKNLLTINARILGLMSALQKKKKQHVLKEYNRQRSSVCMDSTDDCCPGRIAMSDIRVPLMWKDNVHFSGKTGDQSYYAFALIRCGDQVRDTSLYEITSADTDMYFAETLIFEDLLPDLKMEFEVYYTVITTSEAHPILKAPRASITIRSSSRRQAHFSAPKFCLAGHVQLCVDDIRSGMISKDLIMGGKGASGVAVLGDITEFPIHPLELWGQFCCELTAQPQCMVQKSASGYCQIKVDDSWCKCYAEVYQCHIRGWKDKFQADKTSPDHFIKLEEEMKVCADDTGGRSCILNLISNNEVLYTLQFLNDTDFMNWKFALRKELHNLRSWKKACHELMHIEELKKSRLSIPSTASFYDQIDIGEEPYVYQKGSSNGTHTVPSLSDIKEMHEVSELEDVFSDRSMTVSEPDSSNHLNLAENNVQPSNEIQPKGEVAPSSVSSDNGSTATSQNQETETETALPTQQDVSQETAETSGNNILSPSKESTNVISDYDESEKENVDKNDIHMDDANRKDSDTNISEELPQDEKQTADEMDISSGVDSSGVVILSHNFPVESNLDEISADENKGDFSPTLNCDQPNTSLEVPYSLDSTVSETDTSCVLSDTSFELNSTVDTTANEPDTDSCVQSDTSFDVIPSVNTSINEPETDSCIESDTSFDVVSSMISDTDVPGTDPCNRISSVDMETDEYEKEKTNLDNDSENKSAPYADKINESEEKSNSEMEKVVKGEEDLEIVKEGYAQDSKNLRGELDEDLSMSEKNNNEGSATGLKQSLACDDECAANNENDERGIIECVVEDGSPSLKQCTDQVGVEGVTLLDGQNGTDQDTGIMKDTDSGKNVALPIEDVGSTNLDRSTSVSCDVQADDKQNLSANNTELSVETTERPDQNISISTDDELAMSVTSVLEKEKDEVNFDNSIEVDSCITDLDSKNEDNDKVDLHECHSETVQTSDVDQRTSSTDDTCNDS